jgi:hypothetical protein
MLSPKEQVILAEERARESTPVPFRSEEDVRIALQQMSHSGGESDKKSAPEA